MLRPCRDGYRLCDELLGRFMRLLDDSTVLVVASSMGQQPFVSDRYRDGKIVVRFRDIDSLLDMLGRDGIDEVGADDGAAMEPAHSAMLPAAPKSRH